MSLVEKILPYFVSRVLPVFVQRGMRSHAHAPAHAKINLRIRKFIRANKYYKHCIICANNLLNNENFNDI